MTFQETPSKNKRPNPSDDDTDQQGHGGGDVDNDGAASDKDTGYTDDLMLLHKELEKEKPTKKVVKSLMSKTQSLDPE